MEFNEKLQKLRKSRGLTQEELARALFVSRAAVSKWELGRGYPGIDTLKDISVFFSVSVDDLLSGDKLIDIAEKENKSNIRNMCDLLFGIADLFSLLLVILPLYPNIIDGFVGAVNLPAYTNISPVYKTVYYVMFAALVASGALKILFTKIKAEKADRILTVFSVSVNILAVMFLAATGEVYAVVMALLLLIAKGMVLIRRAGVR